MALSVISSFAVDVLYHIALVENSKYQDSNRITSKTNEHHSSCWSVGMRSHTSKPHVTEKLISAPKTRTHPSYARGLWVDAWMSR